MNWHFKESKTTETGNKLLLKENVKKVVKTPSRIIKANCLWTSTSETFLSNQFALEYWLKYLLENEIDWNFRDWKWKGTK